VKQLDIQIQDRDEKGPWKNWFHGSLIFPEVHIYRVSVFLKIGDEILVTWVVVPSIEGALETLKRYERDRNFLVGSVEKINEF